MNDQEVLARIAQLELELARIHTELTELRSIVRGHMSAPPLTGPRRRTQAFAAVTDPRVDPRGGPREAPTQELPAQSEPRMRPTPSVPVASETVPTTRPERRHAGHRTGLTEYPPEGGADSVRPTHPSTPRIRPEAPGAGRYVYFEPAAEDATTGTPKSGRRR